MYRYSIFIILSLANVYVANFCFLAIVNRVAMNVQHLGLWSILRGLWIYVLKVINLDHTVDLCLTFWRTSCLFLHCLYQMQLLPTVNKAIFISTYKPGFVIFLILAIMQWNHKVMLIFIAQFLIQSFLLLRFSFWFTDLLLNV